MFITIKQGVHNSVREHTQEYIYLRESAHESARMITEGSDVVGLDLKCLIRYDSPI